ncbi:hypothetical protein ES703_71237 [subsurface metagenome]
MEISVIIPTYYRHVDLSELFESILKQTINPFEVIIVDDTPKDTIKIVCERYESKFEKINTECKFIRNPRERSAAIARNVGVENSSGDIILFLDSDVILYPDFIEKILEVFKDNPDTIGVQGWTIPYREYNKFIYYSYQVFAKIFSLHHDSINRCKFYETPVLLTKVINCVFLSSSNMALKKNILNEYRFDENLKEYSYMEDKLLSHSIYKKYPNSLFRTPHAKIIHKYSEAGRMEDKDLYEHKNRCRKYVLRKLFGTKGLLLYNWQTIGISIMRIFKTYFTFFSKIPISDDK